MVCKLLSNAKATDSCSYRVSEVLVILLAFSLSCEWNELHHMDRSIQTPEDRTPSSTAVTFSNTQTLIWTSICFNSSWRDFCEVLECLFGDLSLFTRFIIYKIRPGSQSSQRCLMGSGVRALWGAFKFFLINPCPSKSLLCALQSVNSYRSD